MMVVKLEKVVCDETNNTEKDLKDGRLNATVVLSFNEEDYLHHATPGCQHVIVDAPGGGIKCTKCPGWFCY